MRTITISVAEMWKKSKVSLNVPRTLGGRGKRVQLTLLANYSTPTKDGGNLSKETLGRQFHLGISNWGVGGLGRGAFIFFTNTEVNKCCI